MSQVREGRSTAGSGGADQGTVRRANLALLLRSLRDAGPRSRARLAADLGLNKATVSSLVSELAGARTGPRGQCRTGRRRPSRHHRGDQRRRAFGVGAEINVHHVSTLGDRPRRPDGQRAPTSVDTGGLAPEDVVDRLAELLTARWPTSPPRGAPGLGGGRGRRSRRPGTAASDGGPEPRLAGRTRRRPAPRAAAGPAYLVEVDNEANLAAVAEATPGDPQRRDILVIHGEVGIGGGIVADGRPCRGRLGYAGEFGHMIVDRGGRQCGCGRRGCWETVVGLSRLLEVAADDDDLVRAPGPRPRAAGRGDQPPGGRRRRPDPRPPCTRWAAGSASAPQRSPTLSTRR